MLPSLENDLLWQARNADSAGDYGKADQLRKEWREKVGERVCNTC